MVLSEFSPTNRLLAHIAFGIGVSDLTPEAAGYAVDISLYWIVDHLCFQYDVFLLGSVVQHNVPEHDMHSTLEQSNLSSSTKLLKKLKTVLANNNILVRVNQ